MSINAITTCLWFAQNNAEDAVQQYISIFNSAPSTSTTAPKSEILKTTRYPENSHGQKAGSVMLVDFSLRGHSFTGLNGGEQGFSLSPAVSFQVDVGTQEEVDHFWEGLCEGGNEEMQRCGWLVDRFGVSWQVVPRQLKEWLASDDKEAVARVNGVMMGMKKLDIAELKKAFEG